MANFLNDYTSKPCVSGGIGKGKKLRSKFSLTQDLNKH
jgi:hypothetical protein